MQPLQHYAYTSMLSPTASPSCVIDVVRAARQRNQHMAVTGVLVFDGWRFFQYLEGPASAIRTVVASIFRDPRHQGITRLSHGPASNPRRFGSWNMAYAIADDETLLPALAARKGEGLANDLEKLIACVDLGP